MSESLQMMAILTVLALAPSILIMMTSFTRIVISLYFLKSAIGTQQMPPNQIIIGLALFLTFFVMSPVFTQINESTLIPYQEEKITQEQMIEQIIYPMKEFMIRQTRDEDIKLFMDLSNRESLTNESQIIQELPLYVVVPAFIISEVRAGFIIGFLIYLPFIVIDMVVASTLMSMGMMMLPPAMIALPFKILLFILVDGWNLIIGQIVQTFR
ncbi:MAG: flagellar type III secretion system pore protein FliP [Cellulosilyticaceae bacterium]